jgi:GNAT superfamily N-acetyltransferase
MANDDYEVIERTPTVEEYLRMRTVVGWRPFDEQMAATALANSLCAVSVLFHGELIGCGRVVGDGAAFFYLQDVAIHPAFQGKGLGKRLVTALMNYIQLHAHPNTTIGLFAAPGAADFYLQFGFEVWPDRPGMMQIWR